MHVKTNKNLSLNYLYFFENINISCKFTLHISTETQSISALRIRSLILPTYILHTFHSKGVKTQNIIQYRLPLLDLAFQERTGSYSSGFL